jgi:hypothetical protein
VRTQLLCTFTNEGEFETIIDKILKFDLFSRKIFILKLEPSKELVISYNVIPSDHQRFLQSTIMVHRKKESNTMYTINALNRLIMTINGGVADRDYQVNWDDYKNTLILTDASGYKIMKTSLFRIIDVNN